MSGNAMARTKWQLFRLRASFWSMTTPRCFSLSETLRNRLGPCTVDACGSGVQALDFIGAHTYDTIISDVTMPGMDGWQFLRAVRNRSAIRRSSSCQAGQTMN